MNRARRNNLDICADILSVAQAGARKTQIVYQANLNFKIVKRYIERLTNGGMLDSEESRFYTTEKGIDFLDNYRALTSPIKELEMIQD